MSLAGAGGAAGVKGSTKTSETGETRNQVDYGKTREETYREAGGVDAVSCSLSVPMSWVVDQWRGRTGTKTDPDAKVLAPFEAEKLAEIKGLVASALQDVEAGRIMVVTYADATTLARGGAGAALAGAGGGDDEGAGLGGLVRDYGKQTALAALATVSLFLVSTMVKKSAPLTAPAPPTLDGESVTLYGGGDHMHGVAGESDSLMLAQEVGDDAVYAGADARAGAVARQGEPRGRRRPRQAMAQRRLSRSARRSPQDIALHAPRRHRHD